MATNSLQHLGSQLSNRCETVGTFTLRSGSTSDRYFDKYQFESDPELLRRICSALVSLIPDETECLAGLEMGGIPIAVGLSLETDLPVAFVRKEVKAYGTERLVEGFNVEGRQTLVIEDVVTSGGQIITSVGDLRHLGAAVDCALCVIDRQVGGFDNLADCGVLLKPLFGVDNLQAEAISG